MGKYGLMATVVNLNYNAYFFSTETRLNFMKNVFVTSQKTMPVNDIPKYKNDIGLMMYNCRYNSELILLIAIGFQR